ncbi:MAG: protoheme farnesyltransferase, partial [Dehalococcoidia bacterium]|nr:protoheme farnesyltransferase [Dehalococcoidia bacterium]
AAGGIPSIKIILVLLLGGALASGGASALNHSLEEDIDRLMYRTRSRPVASHRVSRDRAMRFGLALNLLAFLLLGFGANFLSASLAMAGSAFYVLVYTRWLKRSTAQNIVIGGAAGAVPPLVGWATVTGGLALPAFYLFAIIFFWTPPHFWALSLMLHRDYAAAGIPMLPVVEGERWTRWAILLYILILNSITLLFFLVTQSLGLLYLVGAALLGGAFVLYAIQLLYRVPWHILPSCS